MEIHKEDPHTVKSFLRQCGFEAEYSVAEPTTAKNHGGECVATRSFINARPVKIEVLEAIELHFRANLRFAVKILSLKSLEVLLITVYLWDSEGFSPRNPPISALILVRIALALHFRFCPAAI